METYKFFESLPIFGKLKLINKFSNFISKKNRKISKKQYKYYISLIKQHRYLGIFSFKTIKFVKIK